MTNRAPDDEGGLASMGAAAGRDSLPRYCLVVGAVLVVFLVIFGVAAALAVPLLDDPGPLLIGGGAVAALCGVAMLVADVLLPVPASLVMIAHGALFGMLAGAALSVVGGVGAALVGYRMGRFAGPSVLRRVCSPVELARAERLVDRWGVLVVLVTRPVPLLAETVAVMAGAHGLGWLRTTVASVLGVLPAAVLYAAAGAVGWTGAAGLVAFGSVLAVAAVLWVVGRTYQGMPMSSLDTDGGP